MSDETLLNTLDGVKADRQDMFLTPDERHTFEVFKTRELRPRWFILLDGELFMIGWSRTAIKAVFSFSRAFTETAEEDRLIHA